MSHSFNESFYGFAKHSRMMNPMKQSNWRLGLTLQVAVLIACGGLYLASPADDGKAQTIESQPSQPRLLVDATEYAFGQTEPGTTLLHDFSIRNLGTQRLVLNLDDCGCSEDTVGHMIVLPGDHVRIPVSMTIKPWPQRQQRIATITTSDPQVPRIEFRISAQVDTSKNVQTLK